jgi:hypothetical protein
VVLLAVALLVVELLAVELPVGIHQPLVFDLAVGV